jgi:hypothetical protein
MWFLKLVLFVLVTACALVLVTCGWVVAHVRGGPQVKAVGLAAVSSITVHSPSYWLLVATMLAVAAWLCRRWVFVG